MGVGGEFGLDADHFYLWIRQLDRGGYAADEASAADGREDGFDFGHIFEDFQSDGPLAGNDFFVVVGRDDDVSVLSGEFFSFYFALFAAGTDQDDLRTELGGGFALDGGRVIGHDDDGLHSKRASGVGDTLGMIAAGVRDDTVFAVFVG